MQGGSVDRSHAHRDIDAAPVAAVTCPEAAANARRVLDRLAPQVGAVLINTNRNREAYAALGQRVVPDALTGYPGPLAGMAAGWVQDVHFGGEVLGLSALAKLLDQELVDLRHRPRPPFGELRHLVVDWHDDEIIGGLGATIGGVLPALGEPTVSLSAAASPTPRTCFAPPLR